MPRSPVRALPFALALALLPAAPAFAQNSAPQPVPVINSIPDPRDVPFPGTMSLKVDARDVTRGIFRIEQTIPVPQPGRMTLLYPQWLPGNHAPRGQIEKLAGLVIRAGGRVLDWQRDPYDVYAFHVDVQEGARQLDIGFQFLSATDSDQGRVVATPAMLNLQWQSVSLYPAGYFARRIPVSASATYPAGWRAATALRPASSAGGTTTYETVDYDTLVDSPVFAGQHFRAETLAPGITLNMVADEARYLAATPQQIEAHRRLVDQALKLFGSRPFDRYDFLLALTDEMGAIGVEHHRSSENGVNPEYFLDWNDGPGRRNLLPHEFPHSWNGKHRRPAGLWTPDFRTPMRDSLLWVYEGQTQFWGYVLQARSGLVSKQDTLDALAVIAATLDARPARAWRSLDDTTRDPTIAARKPKGWLSWQRSEDYYNEGMMIWLEADAIIREKTGNARGLDDFARAFFGQRDGDWGVVTYELADVVAALNGVVAHDWMGFLRQRTTEKGRGAPLGGFTKSGYRIAWRDEPTPVLSENEKRTGVVDLSFSGGLTMSKGGEITGVAWESPAYDAGLTVGTTIVSVNGTVYSDAVVKQAIRAAKGGGAPIRLIVRKGERVRDVELKWNGGLRYPRLEKTGRGDGALDLLLRARP